MWFCHRPSGKGVAWAKRRCPNGHRRSIRLGISVPPQRSARQFRADRKSPACVHADHRRASREVAGSHAARRWRHRPSPAPTRPRASVPSDPLLQSIPHAHAYSPLRFFQRRRSCIMRRVWPQAPRDVIISGENPSIITRRGDTDQSVSLACGFADSTRCATPRWERSSSAACWRAVVATTTSCAASWASTRSRTSTAWRCPAR